MFYPIALLSCLIFAISNTANSQVPPVNKPETHVIVMEEPIKEEAPKKKFKLTKDMVSINPLKGKETAKIGQQLVYSASVHGSVGYSVSVGSSSGLFLPLVATHFEYDNEEKAKLSGGDAATKYFVFEAKKAGTYEIHASHYFRGDLENDFIITITVEEEVSTIKEEAPEINDEKEDAKPQSNKSDQKVRRKLTPMKIDSSEGTKSVKVGQRLKYSAYVHGSVGVSATATSSDDAALPLVKNYTRYGNPIRARRKPGGDSATEYFVFKAKKAGTYTIQIRHIFRGELQEDFSIVITVL
ncbi:MAG: hypothetical protein AB8B56_12860 [Crocinitomicaceae bacterium]